MRKAVSTDGLRQVPVGYAVTEGQYLVRERAGKSRGNLIIVMDVVKEDNTYTFRRGWVHHDGSIEEESQRGGTTSGSFTYWFYKSDLDEAVDL